MRTAAIAAAASALASFITCQTAEPPPATPVRIERRPPAVTLVIASADMSPDCRAATTTAVRHLQTLGAELDLVFVDEMHPAFQLEPRLGQVAVHAGVPTDISVLAESYTWTGPRADVLRAEVVIGHCSASTVAHEIGHVLGMERQVDHEQLLHASENATAWGLAPEERQP